ncbi:hypothetical protein [Roseateles sp.]|uniref:hypothetical protein n=1 Tax=Roseateles sp. TaxID=1971397 RepID=UPI002F42D1D1
MPFFRNPPPAHAPVQTYDHTSIELDGFEVIVGTDPQGALDENQLAFLERIDKRARETKTALSDHFQAHRLAERATGTKDPAIKALCTLALPLLECQGPKLMPGALRLATAADDFLKTTDSGNGLDRKFAAEIRLRARETMQACIDKTVEGRRAKVTSPALAHSMRQRAQMMRQAFGVFPAGDEVGLDFILDAHGKAAYAFKPMSALAPRALSMNRLQFQLEQALSNALGIKFSAGYAHAQLVPMAGPWSGLQAGDPQSSRSRDHAKLGLLMQAPPGFDLCLSTPQGAEGAESAGRARLAQALNRSPGPVAMEALTLTALCAGETRAPLEGVLVDEAGRSWDLQPGRYLAEPPQGNREPATEPTTAAVKASVSSSADADPGMPMRRDLQRALSQLSASMNADAVAKRCSPTGRELDLVVKAMGLSGPAAAEAARALWPSDAVVQRCADRVRHLSDWAQSCVQLRERLLDEPAGDVEDLADLIERQSSLNWYVSALEKRTDA